MPLEYIDIGEVPNGPADDLRTAGAKLNAWLDQLAQLPPMVNNTAAEFIATNPVLLLNQTGRETDTQKTKVGDGNTAWNDLGYSGGGSGGGVEEGESAFLFPDDASGSDLEKLNSAFATGAVTGQAVWLGRMFSVAAALADVVLTGAQKLTVRGPGGIMVTADPGRLLTIIETWPAAVNVTSVTLGTYTFPNGTGATECTIVVAPGHGRSKDQWIKLVSEDMIPGEINGSRRLGENFKIGAVDGDTLYLVGRPVDTFVTGIRLQHVPAQAGLDWEGPIFAHTPGQTWGTVDLTIRGMVRPRVRTKIVNGYDVGVQPQSCIMGDFEVASINMPNLIGSAGVTSYGVQECGGLGCKTDVSGSENVRHPFTTGTLSVDGDGDATYKYGRAMMGEVSGSTMGTTGAAIDLHSSAYGYVIRNVLAHGSMLGEQSPGAAYQLRGAGSQCLDGVAIRTVHGLQTWAQAAGDCVDQIVRNFLYDGYGDAIRIGSENVAYLVQRPTYIGVVAKCSNLRSFFVTQTDIATFDRPVIKPFGSNSGACGFITGANVGILRIVEPTIDLANHTGNFDLVSFTTGINPDTLIIIDSPRIINWAGKLRSWVNGANTTNRVLILNPPADVTPSGGEVINGGFLTSVEVRRYLDGRASLTRDALGILAADLTHRGPAGLSLVDMIVAGATAAGRPATDRLTASGWAGAEAADIEAIRDGLEGLDEDDGQRRLSEAAIAPEDGRFKVHLTTALPLEIGDRCGFEIIGIGPDGYLAAPFVGDEVELFEDSVQIIELGGGGTPALYGIERFANAFGRVPVRPLSAAHEMALEDAQFLLFHPSSDTSARTWTIPANSAVAFPIGTTIGIVNGNDAGTLTIAITTDELRLMGAGSTGSRTVAENGAVTITKVEATKWIISGVGLS